MTRLNNILMTSSIVAMLWTSLAAGTEAADKRPHRDIVAVAHRGRAPGYPENTLLAFRHALGIGVDFLEVDLRMTKDGIPVLIHNDSVDSTTDGQGDVDTFTLAEIKKLDAGRIASPEFAGTRIPTLEETIALVTSLNGKLLLDIKSSGDVDCEKVGNILSIPQCLLACIQVFVIGA